MERDPLAVLEDVRAGILTAEKARELYGVALSSCLSEVDEKETRRLRGGSRGA